MRLLMKIPIIAKTTGGVIFLLLLIFPVKYSAAGAMNEAELWKALKSGGHFALIRHAVAPGTGDPPRFSLNDCRTQRNLSQKGRRQAEEIGNRFRYYGIDTARVYSSQWCRCLETAVLLGLGPVKQLPLLNSFFRQHEQRNEQTDKLRNWLRHQKFNDKPIVLVTHQVNITAFAGVFPQSGEIVVVSGSNEGEFTIAGTIITD